MYSQKKSTAQNEQRATMHEAVPEKEQSENTLEIRGQQFKLPAMTFEDNRTQQPVINDNRGVVQGFFNLIGYQLARDNWTRAYNEARRFDQEMDQLANNAGDGAVGNSNILRNNFQMKGAKAATTISGEAFEVQEWRAPNDGSPVVGPGGHAGSDLRNYPVTINNYGDNQIPHPGTNYASVRLGDSVRSGEVKSSINVHTFNTGVASAITNNNVRNIVMNTMPNVMPILNHRYNRGNFAFRYEADNSVTANPIARVHVKNRFNGNTIRFLKVYRIIPLPRLEPLNQ